MPRSFSILVSTTFALLIFLVSLGCSRDTREQMEMTFEPYQEWAPGVMNVEQGTCKARYDTIILEGSYESGCELDYVTSERGECEIVEKVCEQFAAQTGQSVPSSCPHVNVHSFKPRKMQRNYCFCLQYAMVGCFQIYPSRR